MGIYVFVVVAIVIVVAGIYLETKRRNALDRVSIDLGFDFRRGMHKVPADLDNAGFYLFTQGQPDILNLMTGRRGEYEVRLFGFSYDAP